MSNYGLKKNLPQGTLYNSQIAAVIFTCAIVFKLSSLPGVVAKTMYSGTVWLYLFMTAFELICFCMIYSFMRMNGDSLLTSVNSKAYKAVLFVSMLYITLKAVFYYAFTIINLTIELFTGVASYLVIIAFLVPIIYLGLKGIKSIARSAEILAPLLLGAIILNLVFLKSDLEFDRNLPLEAMPAADFFINGLRYGQWVGDMLPLMFIKPQNKKLPYIGMSVAAVAVIINVTAMLGVAMYGDALPYVSNLLIRLAGFNQLSMEIGRMEWTSLFTVITMAIFTLSYYFWAVTACSERIFGSRKVVQIAFPLLLIIITFAVPSAQSVADFAVGDIGYALFALAFLLPASLLILLYFTKRSHKLQCNEVYLRPESGGEENPKALEKNFAAEPSAAAEAAYPQGTPENEENAGEPDKGEEKAKAVYDLNDEAKEGA